jgi:hypothetical protein
MKPAKLMVCGHGRHGKDTFCELMEPWKFMSSSLFVAEAAVYPTLWSKHGYTSLEACYADRHNHRDEWHNLIRDYNEHDRARLARELYKQYDIYCGIRWHEEFLAAQAEGLFKLSIWIDASKRLPAEGTDSNTILPEHCDLIIENNGTLAEFTAKVHRLKDCLLRGAHYG